MSAKFYRITYRNKVLKKYLSLVKANKLLLSFIKTGEYSPDDFKILTS